MSAITAYYLNEMNDKLQGISTAISNQKFGLGEWKISTGTIPDEDLKDCTMLAIMAHGTGSSAEQCAVAYIPLGDFDAFAWSSNGDKFKPYTSTIMAFYPAYTIYNEPVYAYASISKDSESDSWQVTFNPMWDNSSSGNGFAIQSSFHYTAF